MKKVIVLCLAASLMVGCGMLQNQSSTASSTSTSTTAVTTNAQSAGQGAGNALLSLYNQYKADGKFDYKNMQNILNTVTLVANCEGLKTNYKDKTYLADFGKGLIASSLGLVTKENVNTVTNSLVDMVKNNETVQNATTQAQNTANSAAEYANTAAQYASSISSLLSLFGNK